VTHFDDHFLNDGPFGINCDEEPKFFDPIRRVQESGL